MKTHEKALVADPTRVGFPADLPPQAASEPKSRKERRKSGLHHQVSIYAKEVTQGRLRRQCCEWEILACQRHLNDLKRQGTEAFPYVFDTTRADRILRWFGLCIQIRGPEAGKPIALQPWQIFDLGCIYGWVHKDSGKRRFRRVFSNSSPQRMPESVSIIFAPTPFILLISRNWQFLRWNRKLSARPSTADRRGAFLTMQRKSPRPVRRSRSASLSRDQIRSRTKNAAVICALCQKTRATRTVALPVTSRSTSITHIRHPRSMTSAKTRSAKETKAFWTL